MQLGCCVWRFFCWGWWGFWVTVFGVAVGLSPVAATLTGIRESASDGYSL